MQDQDGQNNNTSLETSQRETSKDQNSKKWRLSGHTFGKLKKAIEKQVVE